MPELAGRIIHDLVNTRPANRGPLSAEERVMNAFMRNGKLVSIPAQDAKRRVILRFLMESCFAEDRAYTEPEVNTRLRAYNEDVAALRRYLVNAGFMTRAGGEYRPVPDPAAGRRRRGTAGTAAPPPADAEPGR